MKTAVSVPGGRFDRIDLIVCIAIVLVALISRGYRLDEPRAMYFDEVYHARTAAEFLQDWRYGEPHDIYEWTHPHLAKYAMAVSIALLGNDRVIDEQDLGVGVDSAVYERRWRDDSGEYPGILWVGGADGLRGLEPPSGETFSPIPEPVTALALDPDAHLLYVATPTGVAVVDTVHPYPGAVRPLFHQSGITDIALAGGGIVTLAGDGSVHTWTLDGDPVANTTIDSAATIAAAADMRLVVADTAAVEDVPHAAASLAEITGEDPAVIEGRLRSEAPFAVLEVAPDDDMVAAIEAATGDLPGIRVETRPLVAVATMEPAGVRLLDATTLAQVSDLQLPHQAIALALDPNLDPPTLFVGGDAAVSTITLGDGGPQVSAPLTLPGPVTQIVWNESADLIHVVTETASGSPTVAVIEPEGLTLFADAVVPFTPTALAVVDQPDVPSDPVHVLAFSADGGMATIDAGSNAWAWRLPGVLAGALTILLLYLLARVVSRRRSVGLAVAGLALLDGMMFVTARIAMNDVYVTLFITAAVTLFAAIWTGRWRRPWVVGAALVGVGVLLGLALASKWVGIYAIGGIGLLLLSRSALGRVIVLVGMLGATAVLGAAAIAPADVADPSRNWPFLLIMLAVTMLIGAAMVRRPLPFEPHELRDGGAIGVALGAVALIAGAAGGIPTLAALGAATAVAGIVALVIANVPGMVGRQAEVTDGTPTFLLPGRSGGLPWLFALGCLTLIPVAVYVVSYLPWVALGNQLVAGFPPGHSGETLLDLTRSMYAYHDELRVTHPASSPWWAWMLDLKPAWMYLGDMAGGLTGTIYDGGNPLILWSAIAGLVYTGLAAWRGCSPALGLVVVMFLSMWLPWARVDRATFQYHLTSSLPFALLALALLLSAMWHRSLRGRLLVIGLALAMALVSVALYPTLSALPVGDDLGGWVTRLLPTWAYDYQFSVNLDPPVERPLIDLTTLVVGVSATAITAMAMALAARWTGIRRSP